MRIDLISGSRMERWHVDLVDPDLRWQYRRSEDCQFTVIKNTGLPSPFDQVFLKHWRTKPAPGHELLVASLGKKIEATPRIYGIGQTERGFVYVFEFLPESYQTLRRRLLVPEGESLITPGLMLRITKQAEACFEELRRQKHIYTDWSCQNIMLDTAGLDPWFIDLDSAWSYLELQAHQGRPDSDQFDVDYWCLWDEFAVKLGQAPIPSPVSLPHTMVLTFAAVFGRGLGLAQSGERQKAAAYVRQAPYEDQRKLWQALKRGEVETFQEYFLLGSRGKDVFELWREVFSALTDRSSPARWPDIRQATERLAALYAPPSASAAAWGELPGSLRKIAESNLVAALRTDTKELLKVKTGEMQFSQTHLFRALNLARQPEDARAGEPLPLVRGIALVFLFHLLRACLAKFLLPRQPPVRVAAVKPGSHDFG
jgi:hypothetical protein